MGYFVRQHPRKLAFVLRNTYQTAVDIYVAARCCEGINAGIFDYCKGEIERGLVFILLYQSLAETGCIIADPGVIYENIFFSYILSFLIFINDLR